MATSGETQRPIKLAKDAILEAICEIRFEGKPGVSGILPGMLFSELKGLVTGIERMPGVELPPILMEVNPQMRFIATQKLVGEGLSIIIGEHVVGVTCTPYPGWEQFKTYILKVWSALAKFDLIGEPSRIALKYVNLLDGHTDSLGELANVRLEIGSLMVSTEPTQIRTEYPEDRFTHIIMIGNPAFVQQAGSAQRKGCLIDIDVLCNTPALGTLFDGASEVDELHRRAQTLFFTIISDAALQARGPTYG